MLWPKLNWIKIDVPSWTHKSERVVEHWGRARGRGAEGWRGLLMSAEVGNYSAGFIFSSALPNVLKLTGICWLLKRVVWNSFFAEGLAQRHWKRETKPRLSADLWPLQTRGSFLSLAEFHRKHLPFFMGHGSSPWRIPCDKKKNMTPTTEP